MARTKKGGASRTRASENDVHVTSLEQMKVLVDPRRIRILELLCDEERTTKQVAEILGEPPTRLYHHVAALERVGLIRLARTRQSRGAVEKYYIAVAKAFSADPKLFASRGGKQAAEATATLATQFLDLTAQDLRALLAQAERQESPEQQQAILSYLEVRATPREIAALQTKINKLIAGVSAGGGKGGRTETYRLTVAFFPLAR